MTFTENGFGKITDIEQFRITSRGAKGVKALNVSEKTGNLVCMKAVNGDEDCMIMTNEGIIIRISLTQVPKQGRNTQGVYVIKVKGEQKVSTVTILDPEEKEEEERKDQE